MSWRVWHAVVSCFRFESAAVSYRHYEVSCNALTVKVRTPCRLKTLIDQWFWRQDELAEVNAAQANF